MEGAGGGGGDGDPDATQGSQSNMDNTGGRDRRGREKDRVARDQEIKKTSRFAEASDDYDMIPDEDEMSRVLGFLPAFPRILRRTPGQFDVDPIAAIQVITQQSTRHARRVYVGGLPTGITKKSLASHFNEAMAAIGGNAAGPGDAVIHVYINHDQRYAFVEMRSVEEASNALALDQTELQGAPLKVRRPDDYDPKLAAVLGPSKPNESVEAAALELFHATESDRLAVLQGMVPLRAMTQQEQKLVFEAVAPPTKVVCLLQVVDIDELRDDDEYEEIMEDVRREGEKYGRLLNVVIPRPNPNGEATSGLGNAFLEYADIDEAGKARFAMHGRKFGGNQVIAVCYSEKLFSEGIYDA